MIERSHPPFCQTDVSGSALAKHRKVWAGKSDEWLFNRLDLELKDKVEVIGVLLNRINDLEKMLCDCQDVQKGLLSNSCPIHNDNPIIEDDYGDRS